MTDPKLTAEHAGGAPQKPEYQEYDIDGAVDFILAQMLDQSRPESQRFPIELIEQGCICRRLAENVLNWYLQYEEARLLCTSKGIELIAHERGRQMVAEGWTPEHDAQHTAGELALAGAAYAAGIPLFKEERRYTNGDTRLPHLYMVNAWPWDAHWFKPKDRIRDLTRAGALIAAELDRLLAAGEGTQTAPEPK